MKAAIAATTMAVAKDSVLVAQASAKPAAARPQPLAILLVLDAPSGDASRAARARGRHQSRYRR